MRGIKPKRTDNKDYRVTVRLDAQTYLSLQEAAQKGKIGNLSEALRDMIRQKLWEQRFSSEILDDLKLNEVNDKDLRRTVNRLLGDMGASEDRKLLTVNGFLEGMFSALGGLVKKAVVELEKREQSSSLCRR